MKDPDPIPIDVIIVAVPETAGSALYGMLDVLLAAGISGRRWFVPILLIRSLGSGLFPRQASHLPAATASRYARSCRLRKTLKPRL